MAGIFDRILPGTEDRLPVHFLTAAVYLGVRNVFTNQALLTGLNSLLQNPLTQSEQADLLAIKTNAELGTAVQKVDYFFRLESVNLAVEAGILANESVYRSELGLT